MSFHEEYLDQRDRFQIIAFNLDDDIENSDQLDARLRPIVDGVWQGKQLPFPSLADNSRRTMEAYGVSGFPKVVLIDPQGLVVEDGSLEELREQLDALRTNLGDR